MDKPWLLDSRAFHTITSDLANLTTHSEYDGIDEIFQVWKFLTLDPYP
jgi:hypothetical protein